MQTLDGDAVRTEDLARAAEAAKLPLPKLTAWFENRERPECRELREFLGAIGAGPALRERTLRVAGCEPEFQVIMVPTHLATRELLGGDMLQLQFERTPSAALELLRDAVAAELERRSEE